MKSIACLKFSGTALAVSKIRYHISREIYGKSFWITATSGEPKLVANIDHEFSRTALAIAKPCNKSKAGEQDPAANIDSLARTRRTLYDGHHKRNAERRQSNNCKIP